MCNLRYFYYLCQKYSLMKRFLLLLASLFLLSAVAVAENNGTGTLTEHKFSYKGAQYSYHLYIPKDLPQNAPLLMVFHGYNSRNIPSIGYGFQPLADKHGFVICYPRGENDYKGKPYWYVGYQFHIENKDKRDDVGFAVRLAKYLQKRYNLSKENLFATGHSNGGAMCYMLAYKAADHFSAVASVSGHIMECMYRSLKPKRAIPVMEVHGTEDNLSRWNGDPYNNDGWGADIATPRAVGLWAAVNRCTHEQVEVLPVLRNRVVAHRYLGGTNGNQVWFYHVQGGKHSWADKDMNTAAEIWSFFEKYIKE